MSEQRFTVGLALGIQAQQVQLRSTKYMKSRRPLDWKVCSGSLYVFWLLDLLEMQ